MTETTPTPAMTDTELEAWFSEAGISAIVVEHCPAATCSVCPQPTADTLADAA